MNYLKLLNPMPTRNSNQSFQASAKLSLVINCTPTKDPTIYPYNYAKNGILTRSLTRGPTLNGKNLFRRGKLVKIIVLKDYMQ